MNLLYRGATYKVNGNSCSNQGTEQLPFTRSKDQTSDRTDEASATNENTAPWIEVTEHVVPDLGSVEPRGELLTERQYVVQGNVGRKLQRFSKPLY